MSKVIFLTSGASFTVPADCASLDLVECVGAGQNSALRSGNGGDYAAKAFGAVTPGDVILYDVGTPGAIGGDTWFGSTATVLARGGSSGATSIGDAINAGGAGHDAITGLRGSIYSGGGGAAGPNGAGQNAPAPVSPYVGGEGDGGNANRASLWTQTSDSAVAGVGDGGRGSQSSGSVGPTDGRTYGGGAGAPNKIGAAGLIVLTYTPTP